MSEQNRQWILVKRPEGRVDESCFEWRESPRPSADDLGDGEFLVRNLCLSS